MTKQEIYDTIVSLTTEIKDTNIGFKLFEAAKSEEGGRKVKEVAENFIKQYSKLYKKMCRFAYKFNRFIAESETGREGEIFGAEADEKNGIVVFDPNVINASSFFVLTFLTVIDQVALFKGDYIVEPSNIVTDSSTYLAALEQESGSANLTNYVSEAEFSAIELEILQENGFYYFDLYELLADVFAGNLDDYVE